MTKDNNKKTQEELIAFVTDPETIKSAAEGSMNERSKLFEKDGWILIQSNRKEGWGTSDFFDTYEQALGGVYVSDDIEVKIVRYRYLPIVETHSCEDNE